MKSQEQREPSVGTGPDVKTEEPTRGCCPPRMRGTMKKMQEICSADGWPSMLAGCCEPSGEAR